MKIIQLSVSMLMMSISSIHSEEEDSRVDLKCQITSNEKLSYNIPVINTCSRTFSDSKIVDKCEKFFNSDTSKDPLLFTPVTNKWDNISYWNKYCGICNHENESELKSWKSWIPKDGCDRNEEFDVTSKSPYWNSLLNYSNEKESKVRVRWRGHNRCQITEKLFDLESTTETGNPTLQCEVWAESLPESWAKYISPCVKQKFFTNKYRGQCEYFNLQRGLCTNILFFPENHEGLTNGENGEISIHWPIRRVFSQNEYTRMTNNTDGMIFFCLPSHWKLTNIIETVSAIMAILSLIFLSIFFIIAIANKGKFKSFPNKILYSYSIALMLTYSSALSTFMRPGTCISLLAKTLSLICYLCWTIIFCIEYFRLIYYTLRKIKIPESAQIKRYLVYCSFGLGLPLGLFLWPILSQFFHENQCPKVPGFGILSCRPILEMDSLLTFFMQESVNLFLVALMIIPFLLAGVMIYWAKTDRVRSSINRKYFTIYLKMAYMIAPHWSMCLILFFHQVHYIPVIIVMKIITYSQGIFLFFAFGFEKKYFVKFSNAFKRKFSMLLDHETETLCVSVQKESEMKDEITNTSICKH